MQLTAVITICIGLITTVLVSLSSTNFFKDQQPRLAFWTSLLAIIFPATGTAFAAIVAFYNPTTIFNQSSRTLASLGQLEGRISTGLYDIDCTNAQAAGQLKTKLIDWRKNYDDIETVAEAAAPTTASQGQSNAGVQGGTPGQGRSNTGGQGGTPGQGRNAGVQGGKSG